jgi:hypothetical protein
MKKLAVVALVLCLVIAGGALWCFLACRTDIAGKGNGSDGSLGNGRGKPTVPTDVVIYQRPEAEGDTRNNYHIELLRIALERTTEKYGAVTLKPSKTVMNELRLMKMLAAGKAGIDVVFRPTSIEDEKLLTPVRIPLDRGLLGYRISLIRKEEQPRFSAVKNVAGLKALRLGQQRDWNDVNIYKHNGFTVVTGSDYEGLFRMLARNRFDYFARGLEEVYPEHALYSKTLPQLHVEESIVIHYPFPRYFWVANSTKGASLRRRLTQGLEAMIADGAFNKIFWQYKGEAIRRARMKHRRVFRIKNPFLPDTAPLGRKELWYDPLKN